jgi:hypothetical protein
MEKTLAQPFADLASSNADVLVQLYRICLETGERLARLQYEGATALGAETALFFLSPRKGGLYRSIQPLASRND